jgi:hypothetical protein
MPCGLKNKVSGHHFFVLGGTLAANKKGNNILDTPVGRL